MNSKYISRYRKALFEEIEEGYGVSPDLSDELERLRNKLISSLRKDIEQHPASKGPYNLGKSALRECLQLRERSMKASRLYDNASAKEREDVIAVFYTIDEAVASLLELLLDNWREAEMPEKYQFPIEWNVSRPLTELIKENARFTTHYTSMKNRLKAAKPAATMPAANATEDKLNTTEATPQPAPLSLRQVALLYTYQKKGIPKAAASSIARQHGHESGAKLYGHYSTVSQRAGRIGDDITGQKLAPMIKDITAVIPHLSSAQQQQAENELKTLQARKETPV